MRKVSIFCLAIFIGGIYLTGCSDILNDDATSKEEIFDYVVENHITLEILDYAAIEEIDREKLTFQEKRDKKVQFVLENVSNPTIVNDIGIHYANKGIVDFYCGGNGIVTSSIYTGFYYSKDDTPFAFEFPTPELIEIEINVFKWEDPESPSEIITEKICDNWYYYYIYWT